MSYLKQAQKLLSGKKTYIVGFISIGLGFYLDNTELILLGLLAMTGRAGLKKVEKQLEQDLAN